MARGRPAANKESAEATALRHKLIMLEDKALVEIAKGMDLVFLGKRIRDKIPAEIRAQIVDHAVGAFETAERTLLVLAPYTAKDS